MLAQGPQLSSGSEEKWPRQNLTGAEIEPKNLYASATAASMCSFFLIHAGATIMNCMRELKISGRRLVSEEIHSKFMLKCMQKMHGDAEETSNRCTECQ